MFRLPDTLKNKEIHLQASYQPHILPLVAVFILVLTVPHGYLCMWPRTQYWLL